jgi:hypothetical protein
MPVRTIERRIHDNDGSQDAGLAALRQVAGRTTVRSVKETVLACMLIWAVRRRKEPRRRMVAAVGLSAGLAVAHYGHAAAILLHLAH